MLKKQTTQSTKTGREGTQRQISMNTCQRI